jgi:hypothetical protein
VVNGVIYFGCLVALSGSLYCTFTIWGACIVLAFAAAYILIQRLVNAHVGDLP